MPLLEYLLDHSPRFAVRPRPFGAFHLVSVALILTLAVLMVILHKRLPRGENTSDGA